MQSPGASVLTVDGDGQFSGFIQEPSMIPAELPLNMDISGLTLTGMSGQ